MPPEPQDTISLIALPFTAETAWFLTKAIALIVLIVAILAAIHNWPKLWAKVPKPPFSERRSVNAAMWFSLVLSPFWLGLLVLTLLGTFNLWLQPAGDAASAESAMAYRVHYLALVGLMTALAGLVAAPFTLIKIETTERQTKAQEEGLITDRINKAVEALGAEKTVKRRVEKPVGTFESIEETLPNIEVRVGAIYALERIAQDSLRDHIQIMEILCAYIRQNAPASSAPKLPEPPEWFEGKRQRKNWDELFEEWSDVHQTECSKHKPRLDVQTALTVIGRRGETQKRKEWGEWRPIEEVVPAWPEWSAKEDGTASDAYVAAVKVHQDAVVKWKALKPLYRLDLRETNLTDADMSGSPYAADFSMARFEGARLQWADFSKAKAQRAAFSYAQAQGAVFSEASAQGAVFSYADAQGAVFIGANAQWADFGEANVQGANFRLVQAQRADFRFAQAQGAAFSVAQAQGARFSFAKVQTANFSDANAQGADFTLAEFPSARVNSFDFTQIMSSETQINAAFGDGSTTLPEGMTRPAHWPASRMSAANFDEEWLKWQADKANYVPPPPPEEN